MPDLRNEIQLLVARLNLDGAKEAEIVEELFQHLSDEYEELLAQGSDPEEALTAVRKELQDGKLLEGLQPVMNTRERMMMYVEPSRRHLLAELLQNLRHSVRLLRLNPAFAVVAILSLALGIGANTAIFQLVNAVRLRALPVFKPQELVNLRIKQTSRTGRAVGSNPQLTYALWDQIRKQQQGFSNLGAYYSQRLNLTPGGEARYAQGLFVSGGFFETLGIQPVYGRLLSDGDDRKNCSTPGVVLSESFWNREYGGDRMILGRKIQLENLAFEIVGVTPSSFYGVEVGRNFEVALPICAEPIIHPDEAFTASPHTWWLGAIGRLKSGWTLEKASAQLAAVSPGIFESTMPPVYDSITRESYSKMILEGHSAANGISRLRREYENPLWLLLAISGSVLLIACANLANLMVARASARQREMAVRLALGASRMQLLRQMLAESLLLSAIGGVCGAAVAQGLSRVLVSFLSTQRTVLFLDLQQDWRVIAFISGLVVITCILFGLAPAIHASRTPPAEVMKAGARGLTQGRGRYHLRQALVVTQVALSLMLTVGAFLFVRTLHNLTSLDAGFQQERLLVANFDFSRLKLPPERRHAYKDQLLEGIRGIPFVLSAAQVAVMPLSGSMWNETLSIPELSISREHVNFNQVSPQYFRTVGTALLAGRDIDKSDTLGAPLVAVVTEKFVRLHLKGGSAVGRTFRVAQEQGSPDRIYQIVGVVRDTKYIELREEFVPIVFVAEAQDPNPDLETRIVLRSNEPLALVTGSVKQVIAEMNPAIVVDFREFRSIIRDGLIRERLMATLAGFFGLLAALLAVIGLYGVISYMIIQRRNEIGIRIALGANKQTILGMIMREAATLLSIGLAIGIFLVLLGGGAAKALVFGMQPNDPITLTISAVGLAAIAAFASYLPARRAANLDPTQALRED